MTCRLSSLRQCIRYTGNVKYHCLLLALFAPAAPAIDRVVFEAAAVEVAGVARAHGVSATLQLQPQNRAALQATVTQLQLSTAGLDLRQLRLQCATLQVEEPRFACGRGRLAVGQSPLGALQAAIDASYHSIRQHAQLQLQQLALAGGALQVNAELVRDRWQLNAATTALQLPALRKLVEPWWQAPTGIQADGHLTISVEATGRGTQIEKAAARTALDNLALANEAGTLGSEKLQAAAQLSASGRMDDLQIELQLQGTGGQALAGPVLLDFSANPLQLAARGRYQPGHARLTELNIDQRGLLQAQGSANLTLGESLLIDSADLQLTRLQFPAAYTSLMQLTLATGKLGALTTQGALSGSVQVRANQLRSLDLQLDNITFNDEQQKLGLEQLQGALHWRAEGQAESPESVLGWQRWRAFGLEGGATQLTFTARGASVALSQPARIPLFDGALAIQRFNASELGRAAVSLNFDAFIEPISMARISTALGWPAMSGQLSGRIPGLDFRNGSLSVAGDITAEVFDGRVTISKLRLADALGNFPRLSGDIVARQLDLDQVTRAFPIGGITGRLDADVLGIELFGWAPVAFDASLYTSPGDRTRHRISQKAVDSLANLGGQGGGVMAALQSSVLRFFDDFGYDRIGLRCQLRNDVCLMNGIEKPGGGFYIVRGGGLPRIDVVGSSGRVAWSTLLAQIRGAMQAKSVEIR